MKKKKRVTAGEVDKLGKELGNCTHQWTRNDDTNQQALSTLSLLQVKEERYVFFVKIRFIQFGCLLLVCPLLCFFIPVSYTHLRAHET